MFLVRYADDFKIFCRNHRTALIVFEAVKKWLKERLNLEISEEKSKVVNLRRNYSEFLGFKFKVVRKGNKKDCEAQHVSEKSRKKIIEKIKNKIEKVRKKYLPYLRLRNITQRFWECKTITICDTCEQDFSYIAFSVKRILYNRTKKCKSKGGKVTPLYEQNISVQLQENLLYHEWCYSL